MKKLNNKGFSAVMVILIVIIIGLVGATGWYVWQVNQESKKTIENVESNKEASVKQSKVLDNPFDGKFAQVGDKVVGMTIKNIQSPVVFQFIGKVKVTGNYRVYLENEAFIGGNICFERLDEASQKLLPKEKTDQRELWFCFTNKEEAKKMIGIKNEGSATIMIDNYLIDLSPTETYNRATLISFEMIN